jgi:FkbM family methyltransferase
MAMRSKYDVASFADVFCQPFYWQLFSLMTSPPQDVLDCGANCGHFTILADLCIRARFGRHDTRFTLVEPNPYVVRYLRYNLWAAGILDRTTIIQGMIGEKETGVTSFWVSRQNYLTASSDPISGGQLVSARNYQLESIIPRSSNFVVKMDIEGGEYEISSESLRKLSDLQLFFLELHGPDESRKQTLLNRWAEAGLTVCSPGIRAESHSLLVLHRHAAS